MCTGNHLDVGHNNKNNFKCVNCIYSNKVSYYKEYYPCSLKQKSMLKHQIFATKKQTKERLSLKSSLKAMEVKKYKMHCMNYFKSTEINFLKKVQPTP